MISQQAISSATPMGANLAAGGATFRAWGPSATAVYLNGDFGGTVVGGADPAFLLQRDANGYWAGFQAGAKDGDLYRFFVVGAGSTGEKRDPYAREMATDAAFPNCSCVLRPADDYPWHDAGFVTPDYSRMVIYQLHVGTYAAQGGAYAKLLDVVEKLPYLASLGINVLQPLPIDEVETSESMGYNGSDYFSPDVAYVEYDPARLQAHVATINGILASKGLSPDVTVAAIAGGYRQLKALVDMCHVLGIAVTFDVVYNHAGGFQGDDQSLYFWDRRQGGDNNDSAYFTDMGWAGGLSFALWNADVRQFLINNALYYLNELHADGFRYDEISALVALNGGSGWRFCQELSGTVRFVRPRALQNAEFWPVNGDVVRSGGAGFDVTQHDGLRSAVRAAVTQASWGSSASVSLDAVAGALFPANMDQAWQAVTCIENHDIVKAGADQRIPRLADGADTRSWYARSRSRWANGLLLTAPGLPMIFMGQEFLEDKQWNDDPAGPYLIDWAGLDAGQKPMVNHLHLMRDLIALRMNHRALTGPNVRVSFVSDDDRVLVFHRWLEGVGADVIVVANLKETPWFSYRIGMPIGGRWAEVFNSDAYDGWPNPGVVGNGGYVAAIAEPLHGFAYAASLTIPANGVLVFAAGG